MEKEHVSALAILVKGKPHTSTMHFAFDGENAEFVYFTKLTSRKCSSLRSKRFDFASISIGFDEKKMIEFQADGKAKIIPKIMSDKYEKTFSSKFKGAKLDEEHIVLVFKPTWWRYTEYKPKFLVISSEK